MSDRERFKREISQIISRNRAGIVEGVPLPSTPSVIAQSPSIGVKSSVGSYNGLPSPAEAAAAASSVRAAHGSPVINGVSSQGEVNGEAQPDPSKDWQVRQRLLKKNPDMNALHVDLVRSGMMSEEEFWEGREVCSFPFATIWMPS